MEQSLFKTKVSTAGKFIIFFLFATITALFERVLYDLSNHFAMKDKVSYFNDINILRVHAIFIIAFMVIALIVTTLVKEKQKYHLVLMPYALATIFLVAHLIIEVSTFFYQNHSNTQFYIVMSALVLVTSFGAYFFERNYEPDAKEFKNKTSLILSTSLVFIVLTILMLVGGNNNSKVNMQYNLDAPSVSYNLPNSYYPDSDSSPGPDYSDPVIKVKYDYSTFLNVQSSRKEVPLPEYLVDGAPVLPQAGNLVSDENSRVIFWWATLPMYFDNQKNIWIVEPDRDIAHSTLDLLSFCKRWYPATSHVEKYKKESPIFYDGSNNPIDKELTAWSYSCIK